MSAPTILRRLQSPLADSIPARVGPIAVAVAAVVLITVAVPWVTGETWWVEAGFVATLLVCLAAAAVDVSDGRIPDRLVLASIVPTIVVLVAQVVSGDGQAAAAGAVLGVVLFAGPLLVVHLAVPHALGFGDVKLAVSLGAALGLVEWRYALAALCLASGTTAAVAVARRRPAMPFAPGLVVGVALVVLFPTLEGSVPWR